ncbi:MAG: phosphate acyltransferase PlsX [Coriobacteriia bacterium]|nr:phosphate acyltransferase PlsX [Coriobacteriia bacterium]
MNITARISVDGLGGDFAPQVVCEGTSLALQRDNALQVILTGPQDALDALAQSLPAEQRDRLLLHPTTEAITMGEHPANAVRTKKDSSLVVAARLVKEGEADGFFSAGSTGACLAAGTLIVGRIPGVMRPAIGVILPGVSPTVLLDTGANADVKPEYLVQFAQMGATYAQAVLEVEKPRIALLNIGEEDTKGSKLAQETFQLLSDATPGFIGNVEGRDLLTGAADVIVADGFTGNVTLKTLEGSSSFVLGQLKSALMSSTTSKLAALILKKQFADLKERLNPDRYGGAPLLGVSGLVCIGHGSSSAEAIAAGILTTAKAVRGQVVADIALQVAQAQEDRSRASQDAPEVSEA